MGMFDFLFGPSKQERFAQLLIDRIRLAGETKEILFHKEEFQLRFYEDGEEAGIANLNNLYAEYCSIAKADRDEFLSQATRALLSYRKEVPEEFEDARHDIRPVVRSRAYFEMLRLEQQFRGGPPLNLPYIDVGRHLLAAPVYDLPESIRAIDQELLDIWGVSLYEVMEIAMQNLEEAEFVVGVVGDKLYALASGDSYDAARLLLVDHIREFKLDGDPVAVAPNRDSLIVVGSEDEDGLSMMLDLIEQSISDPRPISAIPVRLIDGEWETWLPEPAHPLYRRFREFEVQSLLGEYEEQKAMLEAVFEEELIDLFVASYTAIQRNESGEILSYCVWTRDVSSLLPKTDFVLFGDAGRLGTVASATWDKVESIVGDLMEDLDTYPPRYRVTEFPSDEQIERLGHDDRISS
ncbi:DUF1444 family protein [Blastopirellula marina]|uniref:DUF1444 domain-containing protein n=1 Tax=Blastopirellula marina TaxID=124 RepID=A0A2S8FFF4_9BACT|nr:DUF1444 family protein [Blastopirellula marina]PQO30810.1 hypothetical protein C5Y98_20660 [Blastopirellula marina]PTL42663.1 hypothetical protein C5Y97_20670 [Blastopirellula marina]